MILTTEEKSKKILEAERKAEQAKYRLAEAKREDAKAKRKAENQRKYFIGGTVHKYLPECYMFDDEEIDKIIKTALSARECQKLINDIEVEAGFKSANVQHGGLSANVSESAENELL